MSFHFTNLVKDKEGTGKMLLQYSYISLKKDALHWLREIGRIPSTDIDEYFQEIKERNDFKQENKILKKEKEAKDAEILALKAQIEQMNSSSKITQKFKGFFSKFDRNN